MQCKELEQILEQQELQALPPDAAAHVSQCAPCRAMVSDLEAIRAAAGDLSSEELAPPGHIWVALRAQLESEGLIRTPEEEKTGWFSGWLGLALRPAMAAVYVAVLLAAILFVGLQGWLRNTGYELAQVDSQLSSLERGTVSALPQNDSPVTASLRGNLAIVDNAIAMCKKSLDKNPENEFAREYLNGAYQQKAELLAQMMDRGAMGD